MKILQTGDNHHDNNQIEESVRCFQPIIERSKLCDFAVQTGDWFDKNMLINSSAFQSSIELMKQWANETPIIMIRGNHDPLHSLDIFPKLQTKHPIYLYNELLFDTIVFNNNTVEVVAFPYMKKSDFNLPQGISLQEIDLFVSEKMRGFFNNLPEKKNFRIFIGHLTVTNASLATSQTISHGEPMLSPEDLLKSNADVYFLGHIHNHEQKIFKEHPMRYSGPHYRTNFGETQELGFWVWDDGNWEWNKTPIRKVAIFEFDAEETREILVNKKPIDIPEDTDIKLKFNIPEEIASMADISRFENIPNIKIEKRIIPKIVARSAEISNHTKLVDKFVIYAKEKKIKATEGLKQKVEDLESVLNN
jgi:DNA repair exonuclease SbcCD nuclease subunit